MANFIALYDACVFYPAPLRDLLVRLAITGLFRAKWTDAIHDEWIRNLLANRSDIKPEQLQRTRELMNENVPDCLVSGYEYLIPVLTLPDENDRHVLAAAIASQASVIVTANLKDFPEEVLKSYSIDVQHPDEFLSHLIDLEPWKFCAIVHQQRLSLRKPPQSAEELLDTFEKLGLPTTVSHLREMIELI